MKCLVLYLYELTLNENVNVVLHAIYNMQYAICNMHISKT